MLLAAFSLLVGLDFVTLHATTGQEVFVNTQQITTLREPVGSDLRHFVPGTHCVIVTTSGKFIAVAEHCSEVHALIEAMHHSAKP